MNVDTMGINLDKARKALLTCISHYRGIKPPAKVHTCSHDMSNMKKVYIVDSKGTECIHGIIELFDNECKLFKSTCPPKCEHGYL